MKRFDYNEISPDGCIGKGREIAAKGGNWHFHSLSKGCSFNPRPEFNAFLIEDVDADVNYCAFCQEDFTPHCKELVVILHGDSVIEAAAIDPNWEAPPIVQAIEDCLAKKEAWHHHMMKPGCILSPNPKRHVISLERGSSTDIAYHDEDTDPLETLRAIEVMYFASR